MSDHCEDCAPEFTECWNDGSKCRKRPSELAPAPGSANFRVHDALGNWMIEDVTMGRMIAMSTRERDARFIAEALNAYSPNEKAMPSVVAGGDSKPK